MLSTQTHTTVCRAKAKDFTARIFTSSHTFVFIFIRYSHLLTVLLVISFMLGTQTHTTVCRAKAKDFTARIFIHFLSHTCFHFHKFQYICRSAKCVNVRERERKRKFHQKDILTCLMQEKCAKKRPLSVS